MISWATKADYVGELSDVHSETCKVCSQENKPKYQIEQNYFILYWLPIFRTKRIIYKICTKCSFKSKLKIGNNTLIDNSSASAVILVNSTFPKKMKLKYIWGWIIYALIFSLIAILITEIK